jgi:hypothetical protein
VTLLLDTSVVVASLVRRERYHRACKSLIESSTEQLAIPEPALCEVDHLVHRIVGTAAMPALLRDVESGAYRLEGLDGEDIPRVVQIMEVYADLGVGYVDASVLAIVERLGEPKLATLDRKHFGAMRPRHVNALELLPS